ncbi:MAG: DUF1003 domain-containing protein [Acidobacteriota bacterium]
MAGAVSDNIDAVAEFYAREGRKISRPRSFIEKTSEFVGRPIYLGCIVAFVALWTLGNVFAERFGWVQFDPPPFFWLQGIIGLFGLVVGTAVLIRQSRLARLAEQHAHLDLQVNLLTEQKTTKIIQLLEELRRDLPSVADRHDAEVEEMQKPTDPHAMLNAIETKRADDVGGQAR